ncbi:phage shock protein C [Enterococcus sp. PF1-24]|uniref:PspC domain-containing protein n=1 Tax=unclassified Enterococcus TaxID=2608891 RepID=UPI002475AFC3|nr:MULTISPECIES: PspC domain-containing protein [unclassified Enterococcus]MDH6363349.1 phage shock protein C [Enterococcus sp. PFB1-1]MDH6400350.1 phage shock protein C [Enterococcus sp. PF1-24]
MGKRLTKSRNNVVLTGTLGGIAEYINIDPTIVRLIYAFITFVGIGSPVLLYIILAMIIPKGDKRNSNYGHSNPYYQNNDYRKNTQKTTPRKEAEKVNDDDWSDF